MKDVPLTVRQARFVDEFLVDGNGTAAAIRAGFANSGAHVTASRLLRNPKVAEGIREGHAEKRRDLKVEREHLVRDLERAYELARTLGQPASMVAAAREIGRLCGLYEPARHAVAIAGADEGTMAPYEALSDSELLALLAAPARDG